MLKYFQLEFLGFIASISVFAVTVAGCSNPESEKYIVTTIAGDGSDAFRDSLGPLSSFNKPSGIAVDGEGIIYVADTKNNRIRKLIPVKDSQDLVTVKTLAGNGTWGFQDGPGIEAQFSGPSGVAVDFDGYVYVADTGNNMIRVIDPDGDVSTLAGVGGPGYSDGDTLTAQFNSPFGVAVDFDKMVYVSDTANRRIRKISPYRKTVSTLAGDGISGYQNGPGTSAEFTSPFGIAIDRRENLYVADGDRNRIRKITTSGDVTTFAGDPRGGFRDGPALTAQFGTPYGVAVDVQGNVYIADMTAHRIRRIALDGEVTTIAGDGQKGNTDGKGSKARFNEPSGIAVDKDGVIYVADRGSNLIRKIETQSN